MEKLSSLKNPRVLAWRSLKDKKGRDEQDAFLVEGVRMVREALSSSFPVQALLLREGFVPDFPLPESLPAFELPDHVFQAVCDTRTPQGIAAVLSRRVRPAEGRFLVALDGVQDPGNVGTIIRTADAAGPESPSLHHGEHLPPDLFSRALSPGSPAFHARKRVLRPFLSAGRRPFL